MARAPRPNQPAPAPAAGADAAPDRCALTLLKGRHAWRFSWGRRDLAAVLRAIAALARDPASGLDSFDAALLAQQLRERFADELIEFSSPGPSD